jgi:hypothetical protein
MYTGCLTVSSSNCINIIITIYSLVIYRFTCSLIYYALSLNTGALYGNIYVNTFFSAAVEVPAYIVCMVMMESRIFGRRRTGSLALVIGGFVSFACIPLTLLGLYLHENSTARLMVIYI